MALPAGADRARGERGSAPKPWEGSGDRLLPGLTANSVGAILEFNELKEKEKDAATPSRLFIYYNERVMEGTVREDSGAEIRDGIKSVAQLGAPPESFWPYDITKFAKKPPAKAYTEARKHQAVRYARVVQDAMPIQNVLASGYPISFGFTVYSSFESKVGKNGSCRCPSRRRSRWAATRSSRSATSWLPSAYVTSSSLAQDFWVIQQVE